jgi:hypothetical protein
MKRAAFIALVVPVLFFAASLATPFEQLAQADSGRGGGRGGGGSFVGRSVSRGGGDAVIRQSGRGTFVGQSSRGGTVVRSRDAVVRHSGRDFVRTSHVGHRHGGHFSTSVWIGPGWGWSVWDPFYYPYYYPYYRYPYPYYYNAPTVVVPQEPQEYISSPAAKEEPAGYWYYCKEANGYYPYVKRCPGGWMKVVPYQPPPDLGQDEED